MQSQMKSHYHDLGLGAQLASPAGRLLRVHDVFVPRHNQEKSRAIPTQFRHMSRKVVVFDNGSIAPLKEIQQYYTRLA